MTTESDYKPDLQISNQARDRRQALKVMGAALTGGLAAFLWSRLGNDRQGSALDVAPQRATSQAVSQAEGPEQTAKGLEQAPDARPNILFILGDNHNYETMGCAGHPFIETPGMDRIAGEGVLFDNTFSTTALCSPSRASILTGAYARNHEVKNNHTPWTGQMTTFLELLSQSGYDTAFIGKWHMPGEGLPEMPFLDLFVSYTYREGQGAYFNCPMIVNGQETPSRTPYISEEITDYALEFMQENLAQAEEERRPFCIYLSHRAGHPPFQAPEGIAGMYDEASVEGILPDHVDPWWYGKANRNVFQGVMMGSYYYQYRRYCETLTAMDRDIVRLLDFLDEEGLRDNTVVIYLGDNGMQWGTHDCHGIREPYEESIRLPFMVRTPGLDAEPGARRPQMALNIDIAPTLLELAGLPIPADMDGESLVPILRDPEVEGREHFLLEFWRYFPEHTPSYAGVRTKRYKYVEFERGRQPWLFDLQEDPGERSNLYGLAEAEAVVGGLKAIMERAG
jgi:N-acetylglucosamine-6-sulfatase